MNNLAAPLSKSSQTKTIWQAVGESLELRRQAPPLRRIDRGTPLPLSLAQQRLWFIQQTDPAAVNYNLTFDWRMVGPLQVLALEESFNALVQRHENFRSTFINQDGQPAQVIAPAQPLKL